MGRRNPNYQSARVPHLKYRARCHRSPRQDCLRGDHGFSHTARVEDDECRDLLGRLYRNSARRSGERDCG